MSHPSWQGRMDFQACKQWTRLQDLSGFLVVIAVLSIPARGRDLGERAGGECSLDRVWSGRKDISQIAHALQLLPRSNMGLQACMALQMKRI
eukprot:1074697-Pelagomonas_calceolata.AAC.2